MAIAPRRVMVLAGVAGLVGALLVPAIAAASIQVVTLGPADSARQLSVRPGTEIRIVLPSNATTGYEWSVTTAPDGSVLVAAGNNGAYVAPDSDLMGAAGTQTFTYTAGTSGTTSLLLSYARPFGDEGAAETFSLAVTIEALAPDEVVVLDAPADVLPATDASPAAAIPAPVTAALAVVVLAGAVLGAAFVARRGLASR
jgi:inhibitor of cysteine peptidase